MVGSDQGLVLRRALVDKLTREGHIWSTLVTDALLAVPREIFVPDVSLDEAYSSSEAIIVKRIDGVGVSSASAPDVVGFMLEQLEAQPGQRVLEIGAGTGYNAALLSHIVGPDGRVVSIDIDDDLVAGARAHVRQVGCTNVAVVLGDGALGYPDAEPFDRIMLTVSARDIVPAWREQLTRDGGRLVMPLALRGAQRCVAFGHALDHLASISVRGCSFMPLRGVLAADSPRASLNADGSVAISLAEARDLSIETIAASLVGKHERWPTGVHLTNADAARYGLELWLAVHDASACLVWGALHESSIVPDLFGPAQRYRATLGLVDANGAAVLAWADDNTRAGELCVRAVPRAEPLARRLVALMRRWDAAGQPGDSTLRLRAFPRDVAPRGSSPDAVVVEQRWTSFVLEWVAS
jgi:protein-L-isoaspartate(D-aspartate) O-methyltransferase